MNARAPHLPTPTAPLGENPGDAIRALRKQAGLTLSELSEKTGLAVSTLSKLEKGHVSLSYDKLMTLSKGLGVDMAELLAPATTTPTPPAPSGVGGRRVVHRAGEGQRVDTHSYNQLYLATELLNKRFTPMVAEMKARTMDEFRAEFGDFIRHPGEEFAFVIEGEVEVHSELYAPVRLRVGDSIYFDSDMGHAYLKAADGPCRVVAMCAPRGREELVLEPFVHASERRATQAAAPTPVSAMPPAAAATADTPAKPAAGERKKR